MKKVVNSSVTGVKYVDYEATKSLERNNTYVPDVSRVVFGLKTKTKVDVLDDENKPTGEKVEVELKNPILATTLFFSDGTSVTVKNADTDPVETEDAKLDDGSTVKVATRRSKELAIVHAIVKRVVGEPDFNGHVEGAGYGRVLTELVDSGYDQNYEQAKDKLAKDARKKVYAELKKSETSNGQKRKRYSYAEIAQMLGPVVEKLAEDPAALGRLISKIAD